MKKMMMIAAVALTAAFTQAAQVKWSILNVRIPTQTALTISTTGNTAFSIPQTSALVMELYVVPASGTAVDLNVSGTITADGTKASSVLWEQTDAVANRTTYGVNTSGTRQDVTLRLISTYTTAEGTYTLSMDLLKDLENVEAQAVSYLFNMNGQTWSFTPVPEPTSMALLLMGVALVGLKRRIAK